MNPLLIDNKTFKIRMFLTITTTRNKKVNIYLSKYGYIGYSKADWDKDNVNFENTMASPHWNKDFLKKSKNYKKDLIDLKKIYQNRPIFINDFKTYLESKGVNYSKVFNQIKRKCKLIMNSIKMNNEFNSFIVSGLDVIFDEFNRTFFEVLS